MIRKRELRGGALIYEARLAEHLNISRTPLREALQRLEGEGLIVKASGQSYSVRHVDLGEYLQSLNVRELLEGEAAMLAAGRIPDRELASVRAEIDLLETTSWYDIESHWVSDNRFHQLFSKHCGNEVLARLIRELRVTTQMFEIARLAERSKPDLSEHLAILDALAAGDGSAARAAVQIHMRSLWRFAVDSAS
ncbi:GntR family transcriptional regulator [Rhizobium sp. 0TCS1.26]|uniref:GntR family transcriptional regulator n=1 Tax=Rhizobium sp. 0TCS1.26 TaxID=3142623 RepID=UPI003D283BD3